ISDEIYSSLCYDNYYSICQCKDIKDKIILVSGFSKMFSMTGLRVGYVASSEYIMKNIIKVHQYNVSSATSISQYAALEGLKCSLNDVVYMKEQFKKRRDYVYNRLKDM
ncbi:MAG TPA: aspartate aminotransferase, partial [Clostridium sp.]|nr:aspartate aminotransferase [Clostridium sp.]